MAAKLGFVVAFAGLFAEEEEVGVGDGLEKAVEIIVDLDAHERPVIQARPLEVFIFEGETQRFDQVEGGAHCCASADNIAGVLRNLRLQQNDIHPEIRVHVECVFGLHGINGIVKQVWNQAGVGFWPP